MVAWYYRQAALVETGCGEEGVEELSSDFVLCGLARVSDVTGGEDQAGSESALPILRDGLNQRPQNDVAIVGIAAADVKIRDMQPGNTHWDYNTSV
jgi:hypothetical protein